MPNDHEDDRPLDLHAVHALDVATLAGDRAFDAIIEKVLAQEGPAAQLQAALARGVAPAEALKRTVDVGRGRLAEVKHAINFNRDAGLVSSPLTAIRNPDSRHPLHDLLLLDNESADAAVKGLQLKYGTTSYVERAARSGKYDTIVTSTEVAADLTHKGVGEIVVDHIDAARVSSLPVEDAEMRAAAMRKLEARARVRLGFSSKWGRFWERSRVTAQAGWGTFVVTGLVETVQALLRGEGLQMDRSLRRALKNGVRAMAISEIARAFMLWLERRWTAVVGWTERAVRTASEWATPAAAMASFIFDVAVAVWHLLTGRLNGAQFWRRLVGKFGGALAGCLGAVLGFFVGSFLGPAMAMLLAMAGGALFAFWGETWAGMFFDWLAAKWKSLSSTRTTPPPTAA
jgi:hypothetical protein